MADFSYKDYKSLMVELGVEESKLRLKRRWLMNAPLSDSDQHKVKNLNPLFDKSIPESLLRKDDACYDTIKNFVGTSTPWKEHDHALWLNKLFKNGLFVKGLMSVLNGMTNEELRHLCKTVTGGLVKIEEKLQSMKGILIYYLPAYLHRKVSDLDLSAIREDVGYSTETFRDSAIQVLDMLEDVPTQALSAMHGKLEGKTGSEKPRLIGHKQIRTKKVLVSPLRIHCMRMLSKLDEGNPPQEALAEALSLAGVTLKLLCGHTHIIEFKRFPPKVKDLQNRIAKAIYAVTYVDASLLEAICKKLDLVSERNVEVKPRIQLRHRLFELLVECSDMKSIPEGLVEVLNDISNMANLRYPENLVETSKYINKALGCSSSGGSSWENKVEEGVEFLLCFSAQIKQVMLDLLPEDEDVDQDFAKAYTEEEELEDIDEEEEEEEDCKNEYDSSECGSVTESMGETKPDESPPVSTQKQEPLDFDLETDSFLSNGLSSFSHRNQSFCRNRLPSAIFEDRKNNAEPDDSELKTNRKEQKCSGKNRYLSMQRACDETAMAMQRAIDGILNEMAKS